MKHGQSGVQLAEGKFRNTRNPPPPWAETSRNPFVRSHGPKEFFHHGLFERAKSDAGITRCRGLRRENTNRGGHIGKSGLVWEIRVDDRTMPIGLAKLSPIGLEAVIRVPSVTRSDGKPFTDSGLIYAAADSKSSRKFRCRG
jgi:hypothetical protein